MRPFRKKASSSSTPLRNRLLIPTPPAEYIKRQLATFYPQEKDPRALDEDFLDTEGIVELHLETLDLLFCIPDYEDGLARA